MWPPGDRQLWQTSLGGGGAGLELEDVRFLDPSVDMAPAKSGLAQPWAIAEGARLRTRGTWGHRAWPGSDRGGRRIVHDPLSWGAAISGYQGVKEGFGNGIPP